MRRALDQRTIVPTLPKITPTSERQTTVAPKSPFDVSARPIDTRRAAAPITMNVTENDAMLPVMRK
jgi:hypothetical protein